MKHMSHPFPWHTLLEWYRDHGRHHLPWRDYERKSEKVKRDSQIPVGKESHFILSPLYFPLDYRVWLSEILLQQTQVDRVIPYFERILERYSTVHHLAEASYEEFFPYYQGMGYYSRARNILKTAKIVSEEYSGVFPKEKSILEKLPGVGTYTSSAILAFGSGEPYLAWDTNLEKVFARYYHGSRFLKLSPEEKNMIEESFRDFCSCHCEEGVSSSDERRGNPEPPNEKLWIASSLAMTEQDLVRSINNALMDFASLVDLKNPASIDWENYPITSGKFYETRGSLEPVEAKKSITFPTPDASIVVILHKDHKEYYSEKGKIEDRDTISAYAQILGGLKISSRLDFGINPEGQNHGNNELRESTLNSKLGTLNSYSPFILPPALHRDTRKHVQEYFRENYNLELSVRPAHKKWISEDGRPFIVVNAQIQAGVHEFMIFRKISDENRQNFVKMSQKE